MAIFYVNAAGSSTPPFDTEEKGAINLTSLFSGISVVEPDEVRIVNNGPIYDNYPSIPTGVKLLGYGSSKPTIILSNKMWIHTRNVLRDLILESTSGAIFYCSGAYAMTIENCRLRTTVEGQPIVRIGKGLRFTFRNNIIEGPLNNTMMLYLDSPDESVIINNTFVTWSSTGTTTGIYVHNSCANSVAYNNIFYGAELVTRGILLPSASSTGMDTDYNCFYGYDTLFLNVDYSGSHNVLSDPLFTDYIARDYSLQASSPCLDAGAGNLFDARIPLDDFAGNPRPVVILSSPATDGTDIGAIELFEPPNFSEIEGGNTINISSGDVDLRSILYPGKFELLSKVSADPNFASSVQWREVIMVYKHPTSNQSIRIVHVKRGSDWIGYGDVSRFAEPGTWFWERTILIDKENDTLVLDRSDFGTEEDLTITN